MMVYFHAGQNDVVTHLAKALNIEEAKPTLHERNTTIPGKIVIAFRNVPQSINIKVKYDPTKF